MDEVYMVPHIELVTSDHRNYQIRFTCSNNIFPHEKHPQRTEPTDLLSPM